MSSIRAILDEYAADLRGELERPEPRPGTWIFRQGVDHDAYERALEALLDEAKMEGRAEGAKAIAEQMDYQCACRCREHGRSACPLCTDVYGCPVHSEVDPSVLRPEFLKDPEAVARAIHGAYKETAVEEGAIVGEAWDQSAIEYQRAMVEAVRRVVTIRMEARK